METKKKSSTKITVVITILLLFIIVFFFWMYRTVTKYLDTHTWATIQVHGSVMSETADAVEERREVLQGDTYQLQDTVVIIGDITHNGEVKMEFEPAVINVDTDELMDVIVIAKEDILNIKEVCNDGDSASWQIRVINNRYQ